jgi:solute carrier family 45 protein 1/2/4
MSCARSLVVDTLPIHKQQTGAAWCKSTLGQLLHFSDPFLTPLTASRMSSLGHIIGYAMGAIDLVQLFGPRLGDSQFKQLTIIAAMGMLLTSAITCYAVTERILISVRHDPGQAQGHFGVVRKIWSTLLTLPPRIRGICNAVFWAWIGWFPFIIYSSTWVGEIYFRYDVLPDARDSRDALGDMGRIGSMALTVYSTVSFVSAWILPAFIRAPEDDTFTHRPPASIAPLVEAFNKIKPDLLTAWIGSNVIFAVAMFFTPFATSFRFATAIVAFCGIPWCVSHWAPTTFLGVEVNKLSGGSDPSSGSATNGHNVPYRRLSNDTSTTVEMLHLDHGPPAALEAGGTSPTGSTGELSGIYFGILNIYVTIPQFLSTLMSAAVFAVLEPGKSPELATEAHPSEHSDTSGPNAIAVCMFIGALSSLVAAWATTRLRGL